jgi:sulfur carrier protein
MQVLLNGELTDIAQQISIKDLLEAKNIKLASVVVEMNGKIIAREKYAETNINDADKIEIISFVGGG